MGCLEVGWPAIDFAVVEVSDLRTCERVHGELYFLLHLASATAERLQAVGASSVRTHKSQRTLLALELAATDGFAIDVYPFVARILRETLPGVIWRQLLGSLQV